MPSNRRNPGRLLALLLALILGLVLHQPAQAQTVASGYVLAWGLNHTGQLDIPAGLNDVIDVAATQTYNLAREAMAPSWAGASIMQGKSMCLLI